MTDPRLTDDEREMLWTAHTRPGPHFDRILAAVERILANRHRPPASASLLVLERHAARAEKAEAERDRAIALSDANAGEVLRLRDGITALVQANTARMASNPNAAAYTGIGNAALQDLLDAQ